MHPHFLLLRNLPQVQYYSAGRSWYPLRALHQQRRKPYRFHVVCGVVWVRGGFRITKKDLLTAPAKNRAHTPLVQLQTFRPPLHPGPRSERV
jgi:hypothetical protein